MNGNILDVAVIGAGQAGLAAGFYLRRGGVNFAVFDAQDGPGGAWPHTWASLRLFSPALYSSLPGWPMPPWNHGYPPAAHVVDYLTAYEKRYDRPVRIEAVHRDGDLLRLDANGSTWTPALVRPVGERARDHRSTPGRPDLRWRQGRGRSVRCTTDKSGAVPSSGRT